MEKLFDSESVYKKDSGKNPNKIKVLTTCLLLTCTSFAFANSVNYQEAKVSLNMQEVPLKDVLNEIEEQTDYLFVSNRDINLKESVSVQASNMSVREVLSEILKNRGITFTIEGVNIILSETKPQISSLSTTVQTKEILGKIVDINGVPIVGANVVEKGTTNGAISDMEGRFTLNVSPGATLIISYIGYRMVELNITADQNSYNVVLHEDSEALDEVVVIGYGVVKKSDLTGSVSSVKSDELLAVPQSTISSALQGRSAGVHVKQTSGAPGGDITVRIRGTNSILGGNDPLYVIDGFPSNSTSPGINMEDIESIEILKDASAIAIYGSRGSNGVILITTKKGKAGKTQVDFSTTVGFQSLAKKIDMMNAQEYATFYNIRAQNDGAEPFFTQDEINAFGKGFDWQDFIFKTAPIRTHALTISGGSEKTHFALSGNIFDQNGIVGAGGFKRYAVMANIDHEINEHFTVNFSSNLSRELLDNKNSSGGRQGGTLTSGALVDPPILTPYNEDGSYTVFEGAYSFITTGGSLINPLNILNEWSNTTKKNRVLANASLTYKPIDGLYIKILGGVENTDRRDDSYTSLNYYNSVGNASVSTTQAISLLNENTINYVKTFADKHNFSALAGFTYQDYVQTTLGGSGTGFLSDVTYTGNLGGASTPGIPSSSYQKWVLLSTIARLNYNFDQRYLFTFSFRADGSSRYSANNKWGYFPSGAFAWRINEEQFMKPLTWLSDMKLRASYGISGSQAISPYATLNNLNSGKTVFGNEQYTYFAPGSNLPADLKWETTAQLDLGLDLGLLHNRLHFTFDYYQKMTRDLLNTIQLPSSTGYSSTLGNVGKIRNRGFEFSFNAHLIDSEFQWILDGNLSLNRSQVTELYGGQDILGGWIDFMVVSDNCNLLREGEPMGIFYGYLQDGYDDNGVEQYKDLNQDGIINQDDKTKIGDPNPDFIYGLNSFMSYKGFELSLFLQGSQGNDMLNASSIDNTLYYMYGLNQRREVLYDHWTPDNPDAKYPKPTSSLSMRFSNRFIENGSYLRLKNIELGYNLPIKKWDINWVQKVRLSVSLQNMLTLTKYSGWDPDVNSQGGGIGQGIDQNPYPVAKSYTFGINVSF